MLNDSDTVALLKKNRENRARVACLDNKVDTMREQLKAVLAGLQANPPTVTPIRDGSLLTNAGTIPGDLIAQLAQAIDEFGQAKVALIVSQSNVNELGL